LLVIVIINESIAFKINSSLLSMPLNKTIKQKEAIELISNNKHTLLEGGSRSGKTVIAIYTMLVRACHYPNSWHIALRLRFNHAKASLWNKTIPEVVAMAGLEKIVRHNNSEYFIEFPNKSRLLVSGLDDKERVEKVFGNEFATIFLNEVSQISFDSFEYIETRLNPPRGVPPRMILDYNPPSLSHWGYNLFHKRRYPDGRVVADSDFAHLKMNPTDNVQNLSEGYISTLEMLSGNKRKRFLDGEYVSEEGSLWKREWIKYGRPKEDLTRIAIGVDPSGSKTGDEIGIVVVGVTANQQFYVLGDYSLHGTPREWGTEVLCAYENHKADIIVAEKNYGGEMVEAVITQSGVKQANVSLVNATRGKVIRAEPISALYEQGKVFHVEQFPMLEDELVTTRFDNLKESPNRLDACVWAITELINTNNDLQVRFI
jgi:PBSX family phage terminase large subunit